MDVNDGAGGPGVALVDGIAVAIDLERFVEVRARLNGAFAVVFDFSAPENGLALFVGGLKFEPDVEGVHGASGKKWPTLRVRTTTSTRTSSPRRTAAPTRPRGR